MTEARATRPRVPWLTIAMQAMGAVGVVVGVRSIIDPAASCNGLCASRAFGILATIWGLIALSSGIRGRVGFTALMVAVIAPLLISWMRFSLGIAFLLIVFVATSKSKTQLAPYYRWHKEATP
jgi:hypothetical protein